jgi:hypothetical protein
VRLLSGSLRDHRSRPLRLLHAEAKGTCDNRLTITRQEIEARVLDGLKDRLLPPDLVAVFVKAFREDEAPARNAPA